MYPILYESAHFTIYSLWLFFIISLIIGAFALYNLAQASRLDIAFLTKNSGKLAIGSLIVSRIFAIIGNASYFYRLNENGNLDILSTLWGLITVWDKELSFWGAVIGFLFFFIKEAKEKGKEFAKWSDIITISVLSGIAIGNIGTFLDGVNYGNPTNLPWGVTYQSAFIKYTIPVHPTQIYAFIYTTIIVIFLYLLYRLYRNKYDGLVTYTGFFMFSLMRFLEGFFRGDDVLTMFGFIRVKQVLFLIISALSFHLMSKYQKRYNIPIFTLIPRYIKQLKVSNLKKSIRKSK